MFINEEVLHIIDTITFEEKSTCQFMHPSCHVCPMFFLQKTLQITFKSLEKLFTL